MLSILALSTALVLAGTASITVASSIECTTIASGYFSADETMYSDPFELLQSNGTMVFDLVDPGTTNIPVEFQACTPDYLGFTNDATGSGATYAGHVYVTSLGLCLSVQDPFGPPPYEVTTAACGTNDDEEQVLLNWVMKGEKIYYAGETTADGSTFQGGDDCAGLGLYGYQGDDGGIPTAYGLYPNLK